MCTYAWKCIHVSTDIGRITSSIRTQYLMFSDCEDCSRLISYDCYLQQLASELTSEQICTVATYRLPFSHLLEYYVLLLLLQKLYCFSCPLKKTPPDITWDCETVLVIES